MSIELGHFALILAFAIAAVSAVGEDRGRGGMGAGEAGAEEVGGAVRRAVVDDDHVQAVGGDAVEDIVESAGVVIRRCDHARAERNLTDVWMT